MKVTKTNEIKKAINNDKFMIREEFECGKYSVKKDTIKYLDDNFTSEHITVSETERDRYLPRIYFNDWTAFDENAKVKFTIQTTAYGDLDPQDIMKVIDGYNYAMEAVEALTKYFC